MASKGNDSTYLSDELDRKGSKKNGSAVPYPYARDMSSSKDYASDGVKNNDIFSLPASDWQLLGLLTVVASVVRFFRIYQPTSVVFDEVHFGGFASKYIHGKFFMDVHPPLAKMLIALFGWLAGFDGEFDFKDIGKDYLEPGVPYVAMRLFPAICGVLTIPTIFLTLKAYGCRTSSAAFGAMLIIFENGLVTNNRLILLDSPLITATAFTALSFVCFSNQQELGPKYAFTPLWWFWLVSTGLWLGATASIKWVGLFTIAWVGALTLVQLWVLIGDPKHVTPRLWFKHFFARTFCLIVIPIGFYMAMFAIHFMCLVNPGEGDGFMSPEFQSTLNSKGMGDVYADVSFGSRVALRHHNTRGGYLHSHLHMYPEGSKQQQITLYPHKDENNVWLLENQTQPLDAAGVEVAGPKAWDEFEPSFIQDGDVLRLYHAITHRRLHSHDQKPPVSEADWLQEVSAYGYEGFEGDANDLFKVEIVKHLSDGELAKKRLRAVETKFRLVHMLTGCVLFSTGTKLPDWGFEQQEVTCAKQGSLPNSIWYIEQNEHPKLPADAERINYRRPGFLSKFWELQRVMWVTNAGLIEAHAWDSRPPSWPVLRRGINFWGKDHRQIYLHGNPVIWLTSTLAVVIYIAFKGISVLRWQRSFNDYKLTNFKRFDYEIGSTFLGWFLHYFPFFLMARQLFLHHYFPALYFAIMVIAQIYDFIFFRVGALGLKSRPAIGQAAAAAFVAISITVFTLYAPLVYGDAWTKDQCNRVKLLPTWDWDCNNFFDSYAEYANYTPPPPGAAETPAASIDPVNAGAEAQQQAVTPGQQAHFDTNGNQLPLGEKIEYRDQAGNLLDEEQVKQLQANGDVSFQTKYETRTRLVDKDGKPVSEGADLKLPKGAKAVSQRVEVHGGEDGSGVHPPHPDTEGANPNTAGTEQKQSEADAEANKKPPMQQADADPSKERAAEEDAAKAKVGSKRDTATA